MSLATKYRPTDFSDVIGHESVKKILEKQIDLKQYSNCYLFFGPSGTGKTTLARIFANKINNGVGSPIEIDAASNNGVDNIRNITTYARERSLDSEYKIYIIDECHMITNAGWNAFLKCIEEPPKYTIFIFCTTDPQKIPTTISNRVMRFSLNRVDSKLISDRLNYICSTENINVEDNMSLDHIAKISCGSVRTAVANLEKVAALYNSVNINNVLSSLGEYSYDTLFNFMDGFIDHKTDVIINTLNDVYKSGKDIKVFLDSLIDFSLDLAKYCVFNSFDVISIPETLINKLDYTTSIFTKENGNKQNIKYFADMADNLIEIRLKIKYDPNVKTTVEALMLHLCMNN